MNDHSRDLHGLPAHFSIIDNQKAQVVTKFALLLSVLLYGGCSNNALKEGMEALADGRKEDGIAALDRASRDQPRNPETKAAFVRNQGELIDSLVQEAENQRKTGQLQVAEATYRRVIALDARHTRAMQGLEQLTYDHRNALLLTQATQLLAKNDLLGAERLVRLVRAQDPANAEARRLNSEIEQQRDSESNGKSTPWSRAAMAKPVSLEFRDASLKSVFEVLSRSSGLNFVLDKDVKEQLKVTLFVRNSPLEDILVLILATNQLEKRQLNANSFLIYPNTPAKAKEYQELVVRNFYLTNADVKQAQNLIKSVVKSKDIFIDEKLNLLVVKDTPDAIRLVERLIDSLDLAEPEVMLEVEVLEVSRSRMNEFGLNWPESIGYGALQKEITTQTYANGATLNNVTPGGTLAPGFVPLDQFGSLVGFVANPGFALNIKGQNGDTNVLANPRIRVKNRDKAKIHIGDKLPVFTTTSTANVGVSASVNYLDVGLKVEVEPNVTLDDEVSIKVALEVSNIVKEVVGPSNSLAYQVGTRSANTSLRLKNGETQVLAGLISDEERKATKHVPGLGEIPVVGRLFGSHRDTSIKTEIILLITPRIVRNIHRPEYVQPYIASGTEVAVGAAPMMIRTPGSRSLTIGSRSGANSDTPVSSPAITATMTAPPPRSEVDQEQHDNDSPPIAPSTQIEK